MRYALTFLMVLGFSVVGFSDYTYNITEGDYYVRINLLNNESLLMEGGKVVDLSLYNSSSAEIRNTTIFPSRLSYGINRIRTFDSSEALIRAGDFYYFETYDDSTLTILGGELEFIAFHGSSSVFLHGGIFRDFLEVNDGNPNIHVFGTELIIQEGQYIDYLSGKWEDGTSFNISLWNRYGVKTKDYITLHEVPEPCTLSLLALGVFLAGRKRK